MDEEQLDALQEIAAVLNHMLLALDRNYGRLEVLELVADSGEFGDTCRNWEQATLRVIGNLGLSLSAIADGDHERLDMLTSMIDGWKETPDG